MLLQRRQYTILLRLFSLQNPPTVQTTHLTHEVVLKSVVARQAVTVCSPAKFKEQMKQKGFLYGVFHVESSRSLPKSPRIKRVIPSH